MKTEENPGNCYKDNNLFCKDKIVPEDEELSFNGNLEITGIFSGKLKVNGCLSVAKNALIIGEIAASELVMYGNLIGSAKVNNKVVFHGGSSFTGALFAFEADFQSGCKFSGQRKVKRLTMQKSGRYSGIFKKSRISC